MEKETKMTKRDYYNEIITILGNENPELVEFCEKQIEQLDSKAEKAKARAAERKAEGDELRGTIEAILTDDYQTAEEITEQIDDEEVTKSKVVARLGQLVKQDLAQKEQIDVNGSKRMAYKRK